METIGTYKVESTLRPGSRPLYLAADKAGKKFAIKVAPLAGLSEEEKERFLRETATCKELDHPNLVRVIDSGETKEILYQVMEYLEGMDFGKVFATGRPFGWEEKLALMDAVCEGLQYAHAKNLVHRDIKPANIFLENSGKVRVLDFGMVRTEASGLTKVGTAVGTLNYMSPEQIRGETCAASSDVFAVGIVFTQLCTGQHPFAVKRKSLPEILSAILFEDPPAWAGVAPAGAPEGLEFVLRRALEKDPSKRWQNAGELNKALAMCRYTLQNPSGAGGVAAASSGAATAPAADDGKTRVIARPPRPVAPAAPRPEPVSAPLSPPPPRPVAPQPAAPAAVFCPHCTRQNAPGTKICVHCGRPVDGAVAAAATPVASAAAGVPMTWIIAAGAIIAILIAVILVLAFT